MQRQRDGLVPIGDALSDLGGPVQALIPSRSTQHHFTLADQVDQLVTASETTPDLGFMARLLALCSLNRDDDQVSRSRHRIGGEGGGLSHPREIPRAGPGARPGPRKEPGRSESFARQSEPSSRRTPQPPWAFPPEISSQECLKAIEHAGGVTIRHRGEELHITEIVTPARIGGAGICG